MRVRKRRGACGGAPFEDVRHHHGLDAQRHSPSDPRLQYLTKRLYRLRPRALHELLVELTATFGPEVLARLEAHARLDPEILRVVGGDHFPPVLAALAGGRR